MRVRVVLQVILALLPTVTLVVGARADDLMSDQPDVPPATNVQVSTNGPSVSAGDLVTVTITNLGPATIMPRGGRVCDSFWPVRLEQRSVDGSWSPIALPQEPICAAASVQPYPANESLTKSFAAGLCAGTYRAVFYYDVRGDEYGRLPPAYSDPFDVTQ